MGTHPIFESDFDCLTEMAAHKPIRVKLILAKKQKQNRPVPNWVRYRTGNKIKYNNKRRHWRRTKIGLYIVHQERRQQRHHHVNVCGPKIQSTMKIAAMVSTRLRLLFGQHATKTKQRFINN